MTWKGIVSHEGQATITARQPTASAPHAASSWLGDRQPVTRMAHRLDRGGGTELLAQAPDAHLDDVGAGVEAVAPDLGEQTLAAHDLAGMSGEVVEQAEPPVGERDDPVGEPCLAAGQVELEPAGPDRRRVVGGAAVPELHTHACDE